MSNNNDAERTVHQHFYQPVGNVAGRDVVQHAPSRFVYFCDMTTDELTQQKSINGQALERARKEIFFSIPAISLAAHFIGAVLILLNISESIHIIKQVQNYLILLPISFGASLHFLHKKVNQYTPLTSEYKGKIVGIEKELLHRKISSR